MAAPSGLTARQADALADRVLERCRAAGVVAGDDVDWPRFHAFRDELRRTFDVPTTTLTPLAARVLYGLSEMARPAAVAVLGCFAGNLMAFTTGPVLGPFSGAGDGRRGGDPGEAAPSAALPAAAPAAPRRQALGLDVDAAAVRTARGNFARAGFAESVRVETGDAFDAAAHAAGTRWDLLLIDIDVPGARKSGYLRLLERWLPYLAPGALVVAHDVCHPVFRWDLASYRAFVSEAGAAASLTLPVDDCGLEVSRWPG